MPQRIIILSDRLRVPDWMGVDSYDWQQSRPSIEGYEIAILDLYFGEPCPTRGYRQLGNNYKDYAHFYELGTEVARLLQSGAVLIALLGPIAVSERDLERSYASELVNLRKENRPTHPPSYYGDMETSYDWLELGFLRETGIDSLFLKPSSGIEATTKGYIEKYIDLVTEYWVSFGGILRHGKSKTEGTITHHVDQPERWDYGGVVGQYAATVLAVGKQTKLPVAATIQYMNWDGVLVLLPPFELRYSKEPAASEEVSRLCHILQALAQETKDILAPRHATGHEEWVYMHRAPRAKKIVNQMKELEKRHDELTNELPAYDKMLGLLDGTGAALVDAVATFFDKESEGIKVERTTKGAPIDLFIHDRNGRSLAVEVTGIEGYLKKGDPHWADFLQYLPEHHAKNERQRTERILLAVNTQRKKKLNERNHTDDITRPVKQLILDNHICVIRTCDLYNFWLETLEVLPVQDAFDRLFDCEGIWRPSP